MKEVIQQFLDQKELAGNSRQAYQYDLEQFLLQVEEIDEQRLRLYRTWLDSLKVSVQRRKLSAVNQFLAYLYQEGLLADFHRLKSPKSNIATKEQQELLDLEDFWDESPNQAGRLIALLIVETGLLPSEILKIRTADISLDFQILSVEKAGQKRVLSLSKELLTELEPLLEETTYIFERKGSPYSRQWCFRQLSVFLAEKGQPQLSAQSLREQYILRQRQKGVDLTQLARDLGLKTSITLEKYK
ncbi:site-specific tyrosine recombinase XerD [Streptococcus oricebi]|uniref:Tyrosine recombinase XerD-like n=1 Tax=Streptococcus oricebi TaxID=1547447 RepID=A0ABS5B3L3_9STRE|nr:site-specific tyrosine recombinase XerD [Streptococcus oricebi]MBP2623407.1 site-specific tyrosine recombinase XerD [Streptococcus oricebi]